MPDEDKNFGGYLGMDFRKWWRHLQSQELGFTEVCMWLKYYLWIGHSTYELFMNFTNMI